MRFDDLMADLAGEMASSEDRALWDEAGELARAERAGQDWGALLGTGAAWRVRLVGGHGCSGEFRAAGADWVLLRSGAAEWYVPFAALRTATRDAVTSWAPGQGGAAHGAADPGAVRCARGPRFRAALRLLSRHRPEVELLLETGDAAAGRLLQVGGDHVELHSDAGRVYVALAGIGAAVVG